MPRKKEPERVDINKERIAKVAKELLLENGIESTRIDDVAKQAGMSKSTLYVYFESKEAIQDYISLEAMKYLLGSLQKNVSADMTCGTSFHERYMAICRVLVEFKRNYPLNFQLIIQEIKVDDESLQNNAVLKEIYEIGEQINQYIIDILVNAKEAESRNRINEAASTYDQQIVSGKKEMPYESDALDRENMKAKIFVQWGSIYGLIVLADYKEEYIAKSMHMTKDEFLTQGFEQLYMALRL